MLFWISECYLSILPLKGLGPRQARMPPTWLASLNTPAQFIIENLQIVSISELNLPPWFRRKTSHTCNFKKILEYLKISTINKLFFIDGTKWQQNYNILTGQKIIIDKRTWIFKHWVLKNKKMQNSRNWQIYSCWRLTHSRHFELFGSDWFGSVHFYQQSC